MSLDESGTLAKIKSFTDSILNPAITKHNGKLIKSLGDGWLVATEYNSIENRSNLVILNALNVSDGPIATAQLPHRVPYGFHGWFENRA